MDVSAVCMCVHGMGEHMYVCVHSVARSEGSMETSQQRTILSQNGNECQDGI